MLVGTVAQLNLANLGVKWGLAINTSGKLVLPNGTVVPDNSGVLMIAVSPWNPDRAVIAITGQTSAAVMNAALVIGLVILLARRRTRAH